jgi:hypothetical protein
MSVNAIVSPKVGIWSVLQQIASDLLDESCVFRGMFALVAAFSL